MRLRLVVLALLGTACAQAVRLGPSLPGAPPVAMTVERVPLAPANPSAATLGEFHFAGGIAIHPTDPAVRLHGLSDIEVASNGQLVAVGDEGEIFHARVRLDREGRLVDLGDGHLAKLTGRDGRPLDTKETSDAEGLAVLPNGDLLVSLERQHRIWRYPVDGGPPVDAPSPLVTFPENLGMEAIAADPTRGPDAYITAGEDSGQTWRCSLNAGCTAGPTIQKAPEFGVVAARHYATNRTVWLLRSFDPAVGNVIVIRIVDDRGQTVHEERLRRPLTVDNIEGVSVVRRGRQVRFYLLSDDNFSAEQRTLLLAFDWTPR